MSKRSLSLGLSLEGALSKAGTLVLLELPTQGLLGGRELNFSIDGTMFDAMTDKPFNGFSNIPAGTHRLLFHHYSGAKVPLEVDVKGGDVSVRELQRQPLRFVTPEKATEELWKGLAARGELDRSSLCVFPKSRTQMGGGPSREDPLMAAIRTKQVAEVKKIIPKGDVNAVSADGDPALYVAAEVGAEEVVKALLAQKADHGKRNSEGQIPLHAAAREGNMGILKQLKAAGSDLNAQDSRGQTPVFVACMAGQNEAVAFLKEGGANLDLTDKEGRVPLHAAVLEHQPETLRLVLSYQCNVNARAEGRAAAHLAALIGDVDVLKVLVEVGKCNLDDQDVEGLTPLHYAVASAHLDVVEFLVGKGCDVNVVDILGGNTALHSAADQGLESIVKTLLQCPKLDRNRKNAAGQTALDLAQGRGHDATILLLGGSP
eukprot:TRINITY_DN19004_c0_g1_i1.p2 TRINITY_DN19004_c0_g1~~TRINITY_DN19004_c0_g1_i1.p2  ORF type:complete len:431 (-),score=110.29 TRINITY_DN19004_c0_g1_i1:158-1450(-)